MGNLSGNVENVRNGGEMREIWVGMQGIRVGVHGIAVGIQGI